MRIEEGAEEPDDDDDCEIGKAQSDSLRLFHEVKGNEVDGNSGQHRKAAGKEVKDHTVDEPY